MDVRERIERHVTRRKQQEFPELEPEPLPVDVREQIDPDTVRWISQISGDGDD